MFEVSFHEWMHGWNGRRVCAYCTWRYILALEGACLCHCSFMQNRLFLRVCFVAD